MISFLAKFLPFLFKFTYYFCLFKLIIKCKELSYSVVISSEYTSILKDISMTPKHQGSKKINNTSNTGKGVITSCFTWTVCLVITVIPDASRTFVPITQVNLPYIPFWSSELHSWMMMFCKKKKVLKRKTNKRLLTQFTITVVSCKNAINPSCSFCVIPRRGRWRYWTLSALGKSFLKCSW